MSKVQTTEEEDFVTKWTNLPEDLESAIERIKRLEWVLQDLHRGVEIAVAMNRPELMQTFLDQARDELVNKIDQIHDDEHSQPIKIIRVVDDLKDESEVTEEDAKT
jgi:hypothetical protein